MKPSVRHSVCFIALDTFSRLGGLQRFNQRVVRALTQFPTAKTELSQDKTSDIPEEFRPWVTGHGTDRVGLIKAALKTAMRSDVVLIGHVNLLPVAALIRFLAPRKKIILFVHGIEVWGDPLYRKTKWHERFLIKSISKVATVSQHTADRMELALGVPQRKFVIFPNAVDAPPKYPDVVNRIPGQILCVTRMAAHDRGKNVDKLIDAFAKLPKRLETNLVIVGDGELRPELEQQTHQLGLSDRVSFKGRVDDQELTTLFRQSGIFALPSAKEGFGIVYLEAWREKLPVICSLEGASHEVISNGVDGIACDISDEAGLLQALTTLLENPEAAAAMGQLGFEKVCSTYLQDNLSDNLLKLVNTP